MSVEYICEETIDMENGVYRHDKHERIVRCRDCKHYMDYENDFEPNLGYCREFDREEVRNSYFCAWAVRKVDECQTNR